MKAFLSVFLGLLAVGALTQTYPTFNMDTAIRYQNVAMGVNSRITTHETVVLTNAKDWTAYYGRMIGAAPNMRVAAPALCNFERQDLIVVHTGQRFTTGYSVYVSMVRAERPPTATIDYVENFPPQGAVVGQALSSPYVVVAVDRQVHGYTFRGSRAIQRFVPNPGFGAPCQCGCPHCCGGGASLTTQTGFAPEICPPVQPQRTGGGNGGE